MIIACLGDSITAGSPLWDPDPKVRARIDAPDERSQWHWWAAQRDPSLEFRNHGVYGERTDEIAARFLDAVEGAEAVVIQGGINDIAQSRRVETAVQNLIGMVHRARGMGLPVALADVLPWNNGDSSAANEIERLNGLLTAAACGLAVTLLQFHRTLADPAVPRRMRDEWTDDGDHPSIAGYRLLGERAFSPF